MTGVFISLVRRSMLVPTLAGNCVAIVEVFRVHVIFICNIIQIALSVARGPFAVDKFTQVAFDPHLVDNFVRIALKLCCLPLLRVHILLSIESYHCEFVGQVLIQFLAVINLDWQE